MSNIKMLDCTFRDGGYYTDWHFPADMASLYIESMEQAQIDVIEIGFRFRSHSGFKGPFAYSSENFIEKLGIPKTIPVSVMVNAKDFVCPNQLAEEIAIELFPLDASESRIDWVRFAFHFDEISLVKSAITALVEKGYKVGANLMQISEADDDQIAAAVAELGQTGADVLYFADSLGTLKPEDVSRIISVFKKNWDGPIGIHAHDNMGLALQNSMQAIKDGAEFVDATVTGMGRGAGNVRLEELLIELDSLAIKKSNNEKLLDLIEKHFSPLKIKHGWGSNIFYFMAAVYKIHPTFIQELLKREIYSYQEIYRIINYLKNQDSTRFSNIMLETAMELKPIPPKLRWDPNAVGSKDHIVIIGNGDSINDHRDALIDKLKSGNYFTIAMNTHQKIPNELIDMRVACNPLRLIADIEKYKEIECTIVIPFSTLTPDQLAATSEHSVRFCDYEIKEANICYSNERAVITSINVGCYALAIASALKPKMISLIGFDGYASGDDRQAEMQHIIDIFHSKSPEIELATMTSTSYRLAHRSLYAP